MYTITNTRMPIIEPIIIDTDGGADDLLALMLALVVPTWHIIAIMCSYGNISIDKSCSNVLRLLVFMNRTEIPVYRGTDKSLLGTTNYDEVYFGFDGIGGASVDYPTGNMTYESGIASVVMAELASKYQKQISLLALGPLTDVALSQRLDSNFTNNIKDLLIMGGNIKAQGNIGRAVEFNFFCDPEAVDVVLDEFSPDKIVVPWEACIENGAPWEWYDEWIGSGTETAIFIGKIYQVAVEQMKKHTNSSFSPCDLLAVTGYAYPYMVTDSQPNNAVVELFGNWTRGMMLVETRTDRNVTQNVLLHLSYDMTMVENVWESLTY